MKLKVLFLAMAVAALFVLYSCEDDLLDVTEEFEYSIEMVVSSDDSTYTASELVDLAENEELIEKYGDKIKDITVLEVKYWLTKHVGPDEQKITEATLKVANEDLTDQKTIATIEDKILKDLVDNETVLEINQEGLDKMATLIENPPHKFNLSFNSTADEAPLDFTVKFWFRIEMVANPLN
jgi:hypothetical protein